MNSDVDASLKRLCVEAEFGQSCPALTTVG
jgi:hypothetical protein